MNKPKTTEEWFLQKLHEAQLRAIRDGRLHAADGFAVAIAKLKKRMNGVGK